MSRCVTDRLVTTRKVHDCAGCLRPIAKGTRVRLSTGFDDGWWRGYWCLDCEWVMERVEPLQWEEFCESHYRTQEYFEDLWKERMEQQATRDAVLALWAASIGREAVSS